MPIDLSGYEVKAQAAVRTFWTARRTARRSQAEAGRTDQGERAGVTAGRNMDGFIDLACDLIRANGLAEGDIHRRRRLVTLPGYFRPAKLWDVVVVHRGELVARWSSKARSALHSETISTIAWKKRSGRRTTSGRPIAKARSVNSPARSSAG